MPYRFEHNSIHQILLGRFEGRVTDEELKEFYRLLTGHVSRIDPRAGIVDFTAVVSFEVSVETVRELAASPPAISDPRKLRFIIAPAPEIFGFARMFELHGERPNMHVVKSSREAHAILGLHEPRYEPLAK